MKKKVWRFVAVCVGIVFVGGLAIWGGFICYSLARAPISGSRPHSYVTALNNVLELQALVLTETRRGEQPYFAAHIGCAAPDVWQNSKVLANFKHMIEQGVKINLIAGRASSHGQSRPESMLKWLEELQAKFVELRIDPNNILQIGERELPSHSVVAGSARHARGYLCLPEELDCYPSLYLTVRDKKLCLEWGRYLSNAFVTAREGHAKQLN